MAAAAPIPLRGRAATRQRLRAAAWAVFQARGLAGTTVRAIAEEAGCAVGALYTYYPDKDALLEDLTLSALAQLGREVAVRARLPPLAAVTEAMGAVFGPGQPAAALLSVLLRPGGAEGEFGKRATGRLLTALAPLAGADPARAPQEAAAQALAAACFAIGLALFDASGLLARLGGRPDALVEAYARRRS